MAIKTYEAFRAPSPYEQERLRAERQRRYAELLEQQAMEPEGEFTYQGIRAMPSPAAALGKLLSAYQSKKAREKAEEAEARKTGMEEQAAEQIMGRLMGSKAAPVPIPDAAQQIAAEEQAQREAGDIQEMTRQSQYRYDPEGAMQRAMTPQGVGAVRGNPMLAAALQRSMETPAAEEFYAPTETEDGLVQFGKRGGKRETGYATPPKATTPTELSRLITERNALPQNDPQRAIYDDAIRKATTSTPAAVVNLDTKGSQLGQELFIKKIDALSTPATNANRIINQVGAMEDATKKGTFTGAMAPNAVGAAQFLSSFGIDVKPDILANSRAFQAASNQLVLDFMASNGGARGFTEKETAILQDAFPKIVDSPEARQQIATLLRNRAKKDVADYNQAVETYRKSFPNSPIPYNPIEDTDDRYERWKRSQGVK
jgi:hypothetical protein